MPSFSNPNENQDPKQGGDDLEKKVADLAGIVQQLAEGFNTVQGSVQTLSQNMQQLTQLNEKLASSMYDGGDEGDGAGDGGAIPPTGNQGQSFDPSSIDLETLDRRGFMDVLLQQVQGMFNRFGQQLNEQLGTVTEQVDMTSLKQELKDLQDSHPDFVYFKEEIRDIAKKYPDMALADMYKLAKSSATPEKLQEVEQKLLESGAQGDAGSGEKGGQNSNVTNLNRTGNPAQSPAPNSPGNAGANPSTKGGFGGLTPTSGQQTGKPTNMSPQEAVEDAWNEAMADIDFEALNG